MTVNIGVIGVGMIGQDHIRRITHVLSGAQVTAVTDVDLDRAKQVAAGLPLTKALASGEDVIAVDEVDAVIVTSWGPTHEEYVLASIAAGKQVFCEKPLATTREACEHIIDAEVEAGKRLVMVGFMRRYDAGYIAMKKAITDGEIGAPLMFHSAHRNPAVPSHFVSEMIINDTSVHDYDIARYLLDTEITSIQVFKPQLSPAAPKKALTEVFQVLHTASGAIIDIESSVAIQFAYDIRGELVGESGTVELAETAAVVVKNNGKYAGRVPSDWRERFIGAYDTEIQEWINAVREGHSTGPSSWDGYAATVLSDAGLAALASGERVEVSMRDKPDLYVPAPAGAGVGTD
jgi:myo-inositol 2-dehydrogenase/D-chiro-inositol 1-dehydrogenase